MLRDVIDRATATGQATAAVARSGLLGPARPSKLARGAVAVQRRGPIAGATIAAALRWGDNPAFTDELGTLTYREIDSRSNALARAWSAAGIRAGDGIAILARNHRGFLDATYAAAKLGLRAVYMNTEFAGPQIHDVCKREGVSVLVFDEEYDDRAPDFAPHHYRAWTDSGEAGGAAATLEELIASERHGAGARAEGEADDRDAHQRHDRDAEGGAALRGRARSWPSGRCSTASRSAPGSAPGSRRRSFTRSASRP